MHTSREIDHSSEFVETVMMDEKVFPWRSWWSASGSYSLLSSLLLLPPPFCGVRDLLERASRLENNALVMPVFHRLAALRS